MNLKNLKMYRFFCKIDLQNNLIIVAYMINNANMQPFMKWAGGKTQIIEDVMSVFPKTMHNYYEPFLGGGSVLLAFLSRVRDGQIAVSGGVYASDLNANLIHLYKNIQADPEGLIAEVHKLVVEFSECRNEPVNRKAATREEALGAQESYYFWTRTRFNALKERASLEASAMLLFMNKTGWRGLYREGPNGFNVPFGNYKNPTILDADHIRAVSTLIKDVIFTSCPFDQSLSLSRISSGDFVYLDPPYAPESAKSFVAYTSAGFGLEHHSKLFKLCHEMTAKNVRIAISNADVRLVRDAFPPPIFKTKIINCRRSINSKEPDARTNEVLVVNDVDA